MSTFILGTEVGTNQEIWVRDRECDRHLYVLGKTGMGKSVLLEDIALQMAIGGVCLLDPHRQSALQVAKRLDWPTSEKAILIELGQGTGATVGLNLFECTNVADDAEVARVADQVVQVFRAVWGFTEQSFWGPRLEDLLRAVAITLIEQQLTLRDVPRLLAGADLDPHQAHSTWRETIVVPKVRNPIAREFWRWEYDPESDREQREHRSSVINKVRKFLYSPELRSIVSQPTTIPFRQVMDEGKILLVSLLPGEQDITQLVGTLIVSKLLLTSFERPPGDLPFTLIADEFELFATTDLGRVLREGRKHGLELVLAHQDRGMLAQELRGATLNAGVLVAFQVIGRDSQELAANFKATVPAQVQDGQQSIPALPADILMALWQRGHPDPDVMAFVRDYVRPLVRILRLPEADPDAIRPGYNMSVAEYHQAVTRRQESWVELNTRLSAQTVWDKLNDSLTDAILGNPEAREMREFRLPDDVEIVYGYPRVTGPAAMQELMWRYSSELLAKYTHRLEPWPLAFAAQGGEDHARIYFREVVVADGKLEFLFWARLELISRILHNNPPLVASTGYKPTYERPRSVADVEKEVEHQLAALDLYTAKAKIGTTEYLVMPRFHPARDEGQLATIRQRSVAQYYRQAPAEEEEAKPIVLEEVSRRRRPNT